MSDTPKRIWYSPEWDICHRTKQSYASKADITFGIEYIRKDLAEKAKQEALKPIREVFEKYDGQERLDEQYLSLPTPRNVVCDLWQAIKIALEKK